MSRRKLLATATTAGAVAATQAATPQTRFFQPPAHAVQPHHTSAYASSLLANTRVLPGTGMSELDRFLRDEAEALSRAFRVDVDLVIIHDPTPNAFAVNRSQTGRAHGTVMIGRNLARQQLLAGRSGLYSLIGVMAHEWAHIAQYQTGLQQSVKERELHADYMAGWYLANKGLMGSRVDLRTFTETLFSRGDYNMNDMHHGTPQERVAAMQAGVQDVAAGRTILVTSAFSLGLDRVRTGRLS